MANRRFNQFFYSFHKKPVLLTCKFQVLASNGAGVVGFAAPNAGGSFGQPSATNLTFGQGIAQVLGYSSAPAAGNNTLQGNVAIQLQDNYAAFLGLVPSWSGSVTGAAVLVTTGFTLGQLYQITTVGTTTTAGWQTLGVPAGVTPQVGTVFQAATASVGVGTGAAKALASSNITSVETAGDPNYTLQPQGQPNGFNGGSGGWIYLNCWKTATLQQPNDGTIFNLGLLLSSP